MALTEDEFIQILKLIKVMKNFRSVKAGVQGYIQVEHPVTKMINRFDLVKEHIRIAVKYPLSVGQSEVRLIGHAFESRIDAESPEARFQPCPGRTTRWVPPQGLEIRVDSNCYTGFFIPPYYDSLLAKVIVAATDRD